MSIQNISQFKNIGQLPDFIEAVSTSVAIIELTADGRPSDVHAYNSQFCDMLGVDSERVVGRNLRDFCPRYIRRGIEAEILSVHKSSAPADYLQPIEEREQTRWWRFVLHPMRDKSSNVDAILLTCLDVSDKVELEMELKLANERFASVIDTAYDGIVTINDKREIIIFNSAAEEMFGYSFDELFGKPIDILIPDRFHGKHDGHVEQFSKSSIRSRQMFERSGAVTGVDKYGSEFPVEVSIAKIDVGKNVEFTAVIRDVSERSRLIAELQQQAAVDPLTGALNRRAFYAKIRIYQKELEKQHGPVSVCIIDVDHFKKVNDRYGHAVGDEVLQRISKVIREVIPNDAIFARLGGEEFGLMLANADEERAAAILTACRQVVEKSHLENPEAGQANVEVTVSIGAVAYAKQFDCIDDALGQADKALYAAKKAGRNRVNFWSGSAGPGPAKLIA